MPKRSGDKMERGVLGQGSTSSLLAVVPRVAGQDPAPVHFAQNHDMVQVFSSDRSDQTFDVSVLPIPEKRDQHDVIASHVMHITSLF